MTRHIAAPRPRLSPRLLAAYAAAVAALALPLLAASPASAHEELLSTSPEDGSTVEVLPDELTLSFSGDLLVDGAQEVFVTDASCAGAAEAEPGAISIDRTACTDYAAGDAVVSGGTLTQAVDASSAPAGVYTVIASVTYGDGHSADQVFRFTASAGAETPTPTASPTAEQSDAPAATPESSASPAAEAAAPGALPWAIGIGAVVVLGAGIAVLVARARRSS